MTATYPVRPKAADLSLGRTLALLRACSDRMADPYIPLRSQGEHPGLMELADFRLAIVSDEQRAVLSKYLPTDADFRQALYAIGTHCPLHGVEWAENDPDRRTCLQCHILGVRDTRYRGHAVIPYPAGEVVSL